MNTAAVYQVMRNWVQYSCSRLRPKVRHGGEHFQALSDEIALLMLQPLDTARHFVVTFSIKKSLDLQCPNSAPCLLSLPSNGA